MKYRLAGEKNMLIYQVKTKIKGGRGIKTGNKEELSLYQLEKDIIFLKRGWDKISFFEKIYTPADNLKINYIFQPKKNVG